MLGVVLWSDASDRKAVIWCEDQGDLAYLNSSDEVLQSDGFFDAGDLVQFEMEEDSPMRRVCNPRLLLERAATQLPEVLRLRGRSSDQPAPSGADILAFPARRERMCCPGQARGLAPA